LGRLFASAGAEISLAYVRHAAASDPQREAAEEREAEHLLAAGARQLDGAGTGQRVVFNPSTADGLARLAGDLGAGVGRLRSSRRPPPGSVSRPHTADQLRDREVAFSIALARVGLRREPVERSIGTVGVFGEDEDQAARETAKSLAHALGAVVTHDEADLLVI